MLFGIPKVVDAMKPTPVTMQNVMQNAELMQAVNDIAKNPENVKKYKNNPQVMAFYQSMAKTMASRFEQLAGRRRPRARGPAKRKTTMEAEAEDKGATLGSRPSRTSSSSPMPGMGAPEERSERRLQRSSRR